MTAGPPPLRLDSIQQQLVSGRIQVMQGTAKSDCVEPYSKQGGVQVEIQISISAAPPLGVAMCHVYRSHQPAPRVVCEEYS